MHWRLPASLLRLLFSRCEPVALAAFNYRNQLTISQLLKNSMAFDCALVSWLASYGMARAG